MMEYIILKTLSYSGMTEDVNKYIKKGWIPQGGVTEDQNGKVIQAMIKIDSDK